ncbi:MAG: alpha/beta hydrolase family protein [Actinomycetota bacterium]
MAGRSGAIGFGDLRPIGVDWTLFDWFRGHTEQDLPSIDVNPVNVTKWLIDEWTIQIEMATGRFRVPDGAFRRRLRDELSVARRLATDEGWLDDPRTYHREPPPMGPVELRAASSGPYRYEHLRFDSGFEPWPDEPGRERWLDYRPVQTGHAWMLRHDDGPGAELRPWIVLVNGYRTGQPAVDLGTFRADWLHQHHGLNVIAVVLPLHGPRAIGAAGGRVLYSGVMNTVFTLAQGAWDIRRIINWLRTEHGAPKVAITGISLGGYMSGLVAGLEDGLAGVVAGVPEADLARGIRRQMDPLLPPYYEQWGLSWEPLQEVMTLVSPMSLDSLVPRDRRYIYAGLLDRWVRPGNVRDLWDHWERPEILWYQGSHLSFPFERSVQRFVDEALVEIYEDG